MPVGRRCCRHRTAAVAVPAARSKLPPLAGPFLQVRGLLPVEAGEPFALYLTSFIRSNGLDGAT